MKGIIKELLGWLVFIFIVIAASWFVVTFIGQRTQVSGSSMETTLSDGDQLIVDKISYRFRDPKRYDIVVFPYRYEENTFYIKRIIGMPGETVQIVDGEVYIDGKLLGEHYGNELMENAGLAADLRRIRSRWGMMSILSSEITAITVRTAVYPMWACCTGMNFSGGHGSGSGRSVNSG